MITGQTWTQLWRASSLAMEAVWQECVLLPRIQFFFLRLTCRYLLISFIHSDLGSLCIVFLFRTAL